MLNKKTTITSIVKFALSAGLCGIPALSVVASAQDQSPPPEHRQQDREKKNTGQHEEKQQNHPAETRSSSHSAQSQERDRPAEAQPRNRTAEQQSQERHSRPAEQRPANNGAQAQNHPARAAQGGGHRPAPNAHYQISRQQAPKLRQHFQSQLAHVNRNNRPHVVVGGSLPSGWQTYIVPVPVEEFSYLPPVPEGYQMAFYNGYIIVYDPYSGLVLDVIDLYEY
jgi:hypothetical protein